MNIENLALSGGGLKGIVYGGCFQALEECGILKNIKRLAGTSVGALFGYGILLGFTSSQIQELILTFTQTLCNGSILIVGQPVSKSCQISPRRGRHIFPILLVQNTDILG